MSPTRTTHEDDNDLTETMFAMFSLFKRVMLDAAGTCDVGTPERARLLATLKSGPVRAGQLAHVAHLSPSAITETVEALERDGLVRREADPDDRRAVRVALTADGRRQVQRFDGACVASLSRRLARLTSAQRDRIRGAMGELREVLREDFTSDARPEVTLRSGTTRGVKEAAHVR